VHPCYIASINVEKAEKTKSLSLKQTGFKKIPNDSFPANTNKKSKNMQNSNFSSKLALNKADSLQFGIKNANLATPGKKFASW